MIDYVQLDRALHGNQAPENLDEETRAEYDAIVAEGPVQQAEPTEADRAADELHAEVNQFIADKVADMEAKGIVEGSPEEHQYHLDLAALREGHAL